MADGCGGSGPSPPAVLHSDIEPRPIPTIVSASALMPSKTTAPAAPKEPEQTFESALGRLEQIVEEMEADRLPLEDLLQRYEEGTRLVKVCQEKIEAAERRIEIITRGAAGKPQLSTFEAAPPPPANPSALAPKSPPGANQDVSLF